MTPDLLSTSRQPCLQPSCAAATLSRQGTEIAVAEAPFGRLAFLICGDLFGDELVQQLGTLRVDWLLVLIARGFDEDVPTLETWHHVEKYEYARRARLAGVPMLLVNYLLDASTYGSAFGGALVVSADGEILAEWPLPQPGTLRVRRSSRGKWMEIDYA